MSKKSQPENRASAPNLTALALKIERNRLWTS